MLREYKNYAVVMMAAWMLVFAGMFATFAEAADMVGKFTAVEGKVDVLKAGELPGVPARIGDSVAVKDIIRTKSNSKAEIVFNDNNILRLAQRSRIDISEYIAETKGVIKLPRGKVEAVVQKKIASVSSDAHRFEIQTPNAVAGVRGTDFFVTHEKNVSAVIVKEGVVATFNPKFPTVVVNVTAGHSTTVVTSKPPTPPKPTPPAEITTHEKDTKPAPKPKDSKDSGDKGDKGDKGDNGGSNNTGDTNSTGSSNGTTDNGSSGTTGTTETTTDTTGETDTTDTTGTTETTTGTTDTSGTATGTTDTTDTIGATGTTTGTTDTTSTTTTITTTSDPGFTYTPPPPAPLSPPPAPPIQPPVTETVIIQPATVILPPTLTITSAPAAITNDNRALFTFAASAPVTLTLNGTPVTDAALSTLTLAAGTQTLVATATDATNNLTTTVAYSWTTDYTPPVLTVTAPSPFSNAASPVIGIVSDEQATYVYNLDGVAISSPSLVGLIDGSHTFSVSATDVAGNNSGTLTYAWTVDTTPPALTLSGLPNAQSNITTPAFGVASNDASATTYTYTLDGAPVSSPTLAGLVDGGHSFSVTATDAAGNFMTQTYSWTVDTIAPSVVLSGVPNSFSNVSSVNVGAATTNVETTVTYTYTLDGNAVVGGNLTDLAEGNHTFEITATDAAGNATVSSFSWLVDITPPALALSSINPRRVSGSPDASFTGMVTEANPENVYASVDSGAWQTVTGGTLALTGVGEGMHNATFFSYDISGNISNFASYDWFVGNMQYFTTGSAQGDLQGAVDLTSEGIRVLSSGTLGSWLLDMSGTHGYGAVMPATLNMVVGGTAYAGASSAAPFDGYYLSFITANADNAAGTLAGASNFNYLSATTLGSGSGSVSGAYNAANWQLTDYGLAYDVNNVLQTQYVETPLAWSGDVYADNSGYPSYCTYNCGNFISLPWDSLYPDELTEDGFMQGLIGGTASLWSGAPAFVAMGVYANPNSRPLWYAPTEGITADGGAFSGYIFGNALNNQLEGGAIELYIKSDGTTGYLYSNNLTGGLYPGLGMWQATGTLTLTQMGTTTILPSELYEGSPSLNYGYGSGDITGDITGKISLGNTSLIDQNWGIWAAVNGGSYTTAPATNWTAKIGDTEYDSYGNAVSYMLGDIAGTDWSNARLAGAISGKALSTNSMALFSGDLLGAYDASGNWQALSLGAYTETPLQFVSSVYGDRSFSVKNNYGGYYSGATNSYYSYDYAVVPGAYTYQVGYTYTYRYAYPVYNSSSTYYNGDGNARTYSSSYDYSTWVYSSSSSTFAWDTAAGLSSIVTTPPDASYALTDSYTYADYMYNGWFDALFGGTGALVSGASGSLWTAIATDPAAVTMMGSYITYGAALPNLWTSYYVDSYNYTDLTNTTYDHGAYKGFFAAVDVNGAMDGRFIGLYLDPSGNTGYLKGTLTGDNYEALGMFEMNGGVSATKVASGSLLNPADFVNSNIWWDSGNLTMDGSFGGAGGIGDKQNWNGYMDTLAIADSQNQTATENWGVYMFQTYGEYSNPNNSQAWSAKLGGDASFGAYNLSTNYSGDYYYADGGQYSYNYDTNSSYTAGIYYYRPGGAYYYAYYYADGRTYTYDYNTKVSTNGTWDTTQSVASIVTVAPDAAYSSTNSWQYLKGDSDWGYWLADINNGQWANGKVTGDLSGRFITYTKLGTITGDAIGVYNADGTYQLASLGTWSGSGTPLTFMSEIWPDGYSTAMDNEASYTYSDGGNYYSNYFGNQNGYVRYYRPGNANYYTSYYNDGTTYTYDYSTGLSTNGTWDTTQTLASILAAPLDSANATPSYSNSYPDYVYNAWTDAIMGGTGNLWGATKASPASVTMIGEYYEDYKVPVLFSDYLYSYNAVNYTYTTYDNGAYQGFLAGTGINNNLNMSLIALYIDPSGNAGVLRGSLIGTAYPDANVFEMDGGMYSTQVVANVGTSAADLDWSIWWDGGYGATTGSFNGGGSILSETYYSGWLQGYLETMSIVDANTSLAQGWGIYSYTDYGSFTNPSNAQTWSAKLGGDAAFGAYNAGKHYYGSYSYADTGSYSYSYNTYGTAYARYYRPGIANYYTYYYNDGRTYTYNYSTGLGTYGTWDATQSVLSIVTAPPDAAYASSTSGDYWNTNSNYGYWLADISSGTWANNSISGKLNGRYITERYLGTITGDVYGTYSDDGTWQYASLGTWENAAPLSHVAYVGAYMLSTARSAEATYSYNTDSGYYSSRIDTYGYRSTSPVASVSYYRPGGDYYYTYYYGDGTTYTYDYNTGISTNGTWDNTQTIDSLKASVFTPLDQANASLYWNYDYAYQEYSGWMYAYLGGVDSLWGATSASPAAITAIGQYNNYYTSAAPFVFSQSLTSYNYVNNTNTTYDGGAYTGYLIGSSSSSNALNARLVALYIDPSGNAGILKGTLTGALYPDIEAFEMDGTAYATQMASAADIGNIAPEDLIYSINTGWNDFDGAGSFNGTGSITGGQYAWFEHMSIGANTPWGIYQVVDDYGLYSSANPVAGSAFSLTGGFTEYDGYYNSYILVHTAGTFNADLTITGAQTGRRLSPFDLVVLEGDTLGTYNPLDNTWQAVSVGTGVTTPLAWSGYVYNDSNGASFYGYADYGGYGWLETRAGISGLMGDTVSLWTGTGFTMLGSYSTNISGLSYLWAPEINIFDNGAIASTGGYQGFIGGVWKDGAISGKVYSVYMNPAGEAGILTGTVTGAYYSMPAMFEADGSWSPTVLATGLDITTSGVITETSDYGYNITSSPESGFNGSGSITVAGNEMLFTSDWRYSIAGQDWGVWKSIIGGLYAGTASDTACVAAGSCDAWSLDTDVDRWNSFSGTRTNGTKWSDGVLAGQTAGFGADITATPKTWITVGETVGIFDPSKSTFAAVQQGVYMATNKLLDLASTTAGQALLTNLKIPAVEVGRTNLSGSWTNGVDSMTANMNNVVFLAPVTGAAPAIWASNAVSGNFAGNPAAANVAMSNVAANINANFAVKVWDTVANKWQSTINGAANAGALSGYTGAVDFKGAGAGAIDPATGTFSGTAAGIAK